jgi:hypothetical protein
MATRERVWARMADEWKPANLHSLATTIGLGELPAMIQHSLAGGAKTGRVVLSLI